MIHELPVRNHTPMYAPVRILMLYLTEDCNLRCSYCFVAKKPRRMSSETARKAVDWFLSRPISGAEVHLSVNFFGGEPFLELDRMEEVIARVKEREREAKKRVAFSATTNGTVATPRVERLLRENKMHLLVSLDGTREANRERPFLSGKDSYPVVARNLPRLLEWAAQVTVRMTFTPETLDLVGNVRHLQQLGDPPVALCAVQECDWDASREVLEQAYDELADWFLGEVRQDRAPRLEITWGLLRQLDRVRRFGAGRPERPCNVGTALLAVDPDGNVMPCHRFLYRRNDWLGTVDRPELSDERWQYVHLSSRDLLGCDTCPAEPVCGGGCRVVVLNSRQDLHGKHPGYCVTTRAHARAVERIYDTLTAERNPLFFQTLAGRSRLSGPLAELSRVG